jgi:hypothetical protein
MQQNVTAQSTFRSTPLNSNSQVSQNENVVSTEAAVLIVLLILALSFLTYRKHRSTHLQRQVKALEKLWQLKSHREV